MQIEENPSFDNSKNDPFQSFGSFKADGYKVKTLLDKENRNMYSSNEIDQDWQLATQVASSPVKSGKNNVRHSILNDS